MRILPVITCILAAAPAPATAQAVSPSITVMSGTFGTLGGQRKLDLVEDLTKACAGVKERCDVYCSETSFGRYALGRRPVCRVTYRCPEGSVRSIEAAKEELILMRCDEPAGIEQTVDELQPPTYTPPAR